MAETQQAPEGDLGAQVSHGLRWSALNQVVARGLTFLSGVIVLRILSPEAVGTFGAAFAVTTLLMAVNELGLIPTIVQWEDRPEHAARTACTLAIASSCIWYVLVFFSAPRLAGWLDMPGLVAPLRIVALTIPIDGITAIPNAFVLRDFRQRGLMAAETVGMVVQIGLTVGLAAAGFGANALALGQTASNAIAAAIIVLFVAPRIIPGWDRHVVKPLLSFSWPIMGAAAVRDGGVSADSLVVGATLGPTNLGFYQVAFNLGSLPFNLIGTTIGRVSLAGFARITGDRERMNTSVRRSAMYTAVVTAPVVALIAGLAGPLVHFVYGPKWMPAVEALRFLVVLGGLRVLAMLLLDVCIAEGKPRVELIAFGAWIVVLLPALWFGAVHRGIVGAAVAHVVVMSVVVFPVVLRALHNVGLAPAAIMRAMVRPTLAGALAGIVAYVVSLEFGHSIVQLVVGGVAGLAVMAACVLPGNHELSWKSLRRWRGQVA